ncbi:MAG: hypothetical protein Q9162_007026 [Coniocarpon cinnabarinum]
MLSERHRTSRRSIHLRQEQHFPSLQRVKGSKQDVPRCQSVFITRRPLKIAPILLANSTAPLQHATQPTQITHHKPGMRTGDAHPTVPPSPPPSPDHDLPTSPSSSHHTPLCPTDSDAVLPRHDRDRGPPKRIDKQSPTYLLKSGIAGGLAGCAAKTVVGPLDRVKILFQASNPQFQKYTGSWTGVATAMRDIYANGGTRGLFRGHSATLLRIFPYAGIKFLAYEQVRSVLIRGPHEETPWRRLLSGSAAGCVSVFVTYPLEVVRVRLAFETKSSNRSSLSAICQQIYHEQPPSFRKSRAPPDIPKAPLATSSAGAVVGEAVGAVAPRSGLVNFYRGFTPTLWGMLPYAGTSFLTHDMMRDALRRPNLAAYTIIPNTASAEGESYKPPQLVGWAQFAAGGMAGLVSQTAAYPLEVVRRKMQVGGAVGDGRRLGMAEVAKRIWLESGWRGFFVGLGIGYVKVVPMVATSFWAYERSKYWLGI